MIKFFKEKSNGAIILLVIVFFGLGVYVGFHNRPAIDDVNLLNKQTAVTTQADFSPFWTVWNDLNEKYINAGTVSDQDKVYGAISGLVNSMNDPYTVFFSPSEAKLFESQIAGNFSGIGLEVGMKDDVLTVIAPLKGTPAYNAGIETGDVILKINGQDTSNMSIDQAVQLIRGDQGTTVDLTIFRNGDQQPRDIKIVREVINTPTLDTQMRPDGIFVITLYSFDADSADLFKDAIQKFAASGSNKLVLDLRGNPGGYLDAAVDMASWFLPAGKPVVIEDYGGKQPQDIYRSAGYDIFENKNLKFVILIDGGSASASEIFSGAMQDYGIAKLVGTQSFGKGSVQEVINITPDTILKVTVAKWLTPKGTSISEKGLTPDYKVDMTQTDADAKIDPQMDKAVQLLNQ